ncbi:putative RNA-directed DNA polymerase, eukaryota, reverse transcriptase zinc-binding domain protein, partial [Tanacetum coccineum]
MGFSNYRPISLIGCVYKVISKLLASHLEKVIGNIISHNQSAFVKGRRILDGCLVANETIRIANLKEQRLLLFKVEFEKAFDSVNWKILLDIMRQMSFGPKWRNWIASSLSSASISVTILNACDTGMFKGVCLANSGKNISLLQFADDAPFFGEWSNTNASNPINILRCFELGSGLKINLDKNLEEFCEKHYEKLLPIMADKYKYEQRKKEKLEEVKERLDFGGTRKESSRAQESAYSESRTMSPRRHIRSYSPRKSSSVFTRLKSERSRSPWHDHKNKTIRESTVFKRLGSRGWSVSAYSDSRQKSS